MAKGGLSDTVSERPITAQNSIFKREQRGPNHPGYVRAARAINALRDLGIESLDIEWIDGNKPDLSLPKVVVVGDQSSGKSSLIESMSKIKLPVSGGTCTKCPIEVRLSEMGDSWHCKISIRYEPKVIGESPKIVPFDETAREDEVEQILRKAQHAILDPEVEAPQPNMKRNTKKLEFSEDTIIVEVTGASMNFTFIDLPGIINSETPGQQAEQGFLEAVERLVTRYLKDPSCLVLLVIPMCYEIEIGPAVKLVMTVKGEGKECMGVLTKADLIHPDHYEYWLEVLHNRKFPMEHRYYITRQKTPTERNEKISHETARENEMKHFSQVPWRKEQKKDVFGVENLLNAVSILLSEKITQRFPQLEATLRKHCVSVGSQIVEPIANELAQKVLVDHTASFIKDVKEYAGSNPPFVREQFSLLTKQLLKTLVKYDISEESGSKISAITPPNLAENPLEAHEVHLDPAKTISLQDIRTLIEQKRKLEMSYFTPWEAHTYAKMLSLSNWSNICLGIFEVIEGHIRAMITKFARKVFTNFDKLGSDVIQKTNELLNDVAKETKSIINSYCAWEGRRPFTQDDELLQTWVGIVSRHLCQLRYAKRVTSQSTEVGTANGTTNSQSTEAGTANGTTNGNQMVQSQQAIQQVLYSHPPTLAGLVDIPDGSINEAPMLQLTDWFNADEYHNELQLIAGSGAYFQVAFKRIIDVIPMCIENQFLVGLGLKLDEALVKELGLMARSRQEIESKCQMYVAEDTAVTERRRKLKETERILKEALKFTSGV